MKCKKSDLQIMQLKKQVSKNELVDSEWKKTVRNMLIQHRQDTVTAEKKITDLQAQNESLKTINDNFAAASKADADALQSSKLEIEALKSELKSKQDLKRSLIHQKRALAVENRDLVDQKSALEGELKGIKLEPKIDECSICFETVSLERKWTAFIPCGHRTCAECAQQISSLPRTTNRRKCPNCRENINNFLVLEGIYES